MTENKYREIITFLFDIIDDIDTYDDIAKEDDKLYRNLVRKAQARRWEIGITCDGYKLDFSNIEET
jgi:hypothetical protein